MSMFMPAIQKVSTVAMIFARFRLYRAAFIAFFAVICLTGQPVPAQSDARKGDDLMPRTQVNENAETPPVQGGQYPPLRLTPDKPAVVNLNKPATNIVVPNKDHAVIRPDTRRTLIIQPRQPGATFFRALDKKGNIIMQRHIFVGAPKQDYVRIHRSCGAEASGCKKESTYYCPGRCYTINVEQPGSGGDSGGGDVASGQ